MPPRDRAQREKQIEDAVYSLLEQRGFSDTNMRNIATAAKASNETLYRWYGDKLGLYRALIDRNAQLVADHLTTSHNAGRRGMASLRDVTPQFLQILLGDRYVALNKAAVADTSGTLVETLAISGRKAVIPMIQSLLTEAIEDGDLANEDGTPPTVDEMFEAWATLAIGDLLALRLIGALPALSPEEAQARSDLALTRLRKIYPPRS